MPASFAAQCAVQNTISLAWRVGRAVFLANKTNAISRVGPILVDALGGPSSAKVLFRGKITGLERTLVKGHTVGAVTIAANDLADEADETAEKFSGWVKIVRRPSPYLAPAHALALADNALPPPPCASLAVQE